MKDPGNYKFAHSGPQIIGTIPTGKVEKGTYVGSGDTPYEAAYATFKLAKNDGYIFTELDMMLFAKNPPKGLKDSNTSEDTKRSCYCLLEVKV